MSGKTSKKRPTCWPPGVEKSWPRCIFKANDCNDKAGHCGQCETYDALTNFEAKHYMEFLWAVFYPEERAKEIQQREPSMLKRAFESRFMARMRGEG